MLLIIRHRLEQRILNFKLTTPLNHHNAILRPAAILNLGPCRRQLHRLSSYSSSCEAKKNVCSIRKTVHILSPTSFSCKRISSSTQLHKARLDSRQRSTVFHQHIHMSSAPTSSLSPEDDKFYLDYQVSLVYFCLRSDGLDSSFSLFLPRIASKDSMTSNFTRRAT